MFQNIPLWFSCDMPRPLTLEGDSHPRLTLSRYVHGLGYRVGKGRGRDVGLVLVAGPKMSCFVGCLLVCGMWYIAPVFHCRHDKGYLQVTVKGEQANLQRVECLRLSTSVTLTARSRTEHSQTHHRKHTSLSPETPPPSGRSSPIPLSKASYTVHIPSEQEPHYILIGWTAPDFMFSLADVASVMAAVAPCSEDQPVETCLDQSVRVESGGVTHVVYSACVMVPLLHLLEEADLGMLTEVTCTVDSDKREVEYTVDGRVVRKVPLQVRMLCVCVCACMCPCMCVYVCACVCVCVHVWMGVCIIS